MDDKVNIAISDEQVQDGVTMDQAIAQIAAAQEPPAEQPKQVAVLEEKKPIRDEKGYFLPGNQESKGLTNSGPPCEFCQRPVEILNKVNLYREYCRGKVDGHLHIPYFEELVSEDYLDITIDQLEDWMNSVKHKEQHSELTRTLYKIKTRQKLYLMKKTVTDDSRGSMFLLSANHGMIEKTKQYQAGSKDEPMEYNIHIVPKAQKQQELENE